MLLSLILALKGTTDFKPTTQPCSNYRYSWAKPSESKTGVKLLDQEYVSRYTDINLLELEIKRQCRFK